MEIPSELRDRILDKLGMASGSRLDKVIACMDKNKEILFKIGIIKTGSTIKKGDYIDLFKGEISNDVIKGAFTGRNGKYFGKKNVIIAFVIAAFGEEWEKVYNDYYELDGKLKECYINKGSIDLIKDKKSLKSNNNVQIQYLTKNPKIDNIDSNIFNNYSTDFESFDCNNESYNVVFFPFYRFEYTEYNSDIEGVIISKILDIRDIEGLNLQVQYYPNYNIRSYSHAEAVGIELKANLVIWGELYENKFSVIKEIILKYLIVQNKHDIPGISRKGYSDIHRISSLYEIKEGTLLNDIDYILYWVIAFTEYHKKNYETALMYFNKIKNKNRISFELLFYTSKCLLLQNSFINARNDIERALVIDPNNIRGICIYCIILMEIDKEFSKSYIEAILEANGDEMMINLIYAHLLYRSFQEKEQSIFYLEKAISIEKHYYSFYEYGCILHELEDYNGALNKLKLSIKMNPDSSAIHSTYGLVLFKVNKISSAKRHFEKAIKLNNQNIDAYHFYALLLFKLKKYQECINNFEKALEIDNDNLEVRYNYFKTLIAMDNKDSLEQFLEIVVRDQYYKDIPKILNDLNIIYIKED